MNILEFIKHLWKHRHRQLLGNIGAVILVLILVLGVKSFLQWWTLFLDPIIGLGTLMVALIVWSDEVRQERESQLPKKLSVEFYHQGQLVMMCKEAALAGENDIRAWGQQLGKNMAGDNLTFEPFFHIRSDPPKRNELLGFYKPYLLTMHLTKLPFKKNEDREKVQKEKLYLLWRQDENGKASQSWLPRPLLISST